MPIAVQTIKEENKAPWSAIEVVIRGHNRFDEDDLLEALEDIAKDVGYKRVYLLGDNVLEDPNPLITLCYKLKMNGWKIALETKKTWEEIARLKACNTAQMSYMARILVASNLDILVDGNNRIIDVPKTMANKKIILYN